MPQEQMPTGLELRSRVTSGGELELSLEEVTPRALEAGEVLVRVEATPVNPSDIGLLLGPADFSAARAGGTAERPTLTAPISEKLRESVAARVDQSMPVGNEGAGTVIRAGEGAEKLVGRVVAMLGGAMYTQYRIMRAADCLVLPEGATARQGASCYVNPLTALGMVETMRREGHKALVHTAAASNLGQMLVKICKADGVPLVNIVRSDAQAALLKEIGAEHVCDCSKPDFDEALTDAIEKTGATLGFDAIGGGRLASRILRAMEVSLSRGQPYNRYGSSTHKQVYIYGTLDVGPIEIARSIGFSWGVGGWLLTHFLARSSREDRARLGKRVADELTTTFASHFTEEISLAEALKPEIVAAYAKRATGQKYLINPSKGL